LRCATKVEGVEEVEGVERVEEVEGVERVEEVEGVENGVRREGRVNYSLTIILFRFATA
jgi:hypothetical protein